MFRMKMKNLTSVFSLASSLYLYVGIYLLKFGKVSQYVGYSALSDYFSSMELRLNTQCSNSHCRLQQEKYQTRSTSAHTHTAHGGRSRGGGRGCGT